MRSGYQGSTEKRGELQAYDDSCLLALEPATLLDPNSFAVRLEDGRAGVGELDRQVTSVLVDLPFAFGAEDGQDLGAGEWPVQRRLLRGVTTPGRCVLDQHPGDVDAELLERFSGRDGVLGVDRGRGRGKSRSIVLWKLKPKARSGL